jgi:tetratricopeptide (TPR) repeat protein
MAGAMTAWAALAIGSLVVASDPLPAGDSCRREEGSLSRYLLCLELHARRPPEIHPTYYTELEDLETSLLESLPRGKAKYRVDILNALYHAGRPDVDYRPQLTLVDALDRRRADGGRRLPADCDVFSLINAGVAERYYNAGSTPHGVIVVRTRHDHVVNAFLRGTRLVGVLETVDGTIYRGPPTAHAEHRFFRPMSEREIVALYLANVGLALAGEGHVDRALVHIDEAVGLNPDEYVAHAGRAATLLLDAASDSGTAGGGASPWCSGPDNLHLLEQAERAAQRAMRLEPESDVLYSLLGRIKLRQCVPDQAQAYLERAVNLRDDPLDMYYLGVILHDQERFGEAISFARRGRRLIRQRADPLHRSLQVEMEFLLAHSHTQRANRRGSVKDLRRAMRFLGNVEREYPDDPRVQGLHGVIDRLDYRIGPVHREFGLPTVVRGPVYDASTDSQ